MQRSAFALPIRFAARRRAVSWLSVAALCMLASAACTSIGPTRLRADQVDYERALGDAKKREMLAAIVGLRYGDAPSFVEVSQIIAAYTFDANVGTTLNLGSGTEPNYAQASGGASYSNHPTFTFSPTTGDAYANAYIRPLPPTLVLPLADSGVPVDLLLRLAVQSIGGLRNAAPLGGGSSANGSPAFFELLRALRHLQLAGQLTFRYQQVDHAGRVSMMLGAASHGRTPETDRDLAKVRRLLHLSSRTHEYEFVYGQTEPGDSHIAIVTRSVLGILSNLGAQIDVPADDVKKAATMPTVRLVGGETRPTVIVHVDRKAPANAYAAVPYRGWVYWIGRDDFDSKYAMSVVQNLIALAQANQNQKTPIVTIPAG